MKELSNAKKEYFLIKAKTLIKIPGIQNEQVLIKNTSGKYFPIGPAKEPDTNTHSALEGYN